MIEYIIKNHPELKDGQIVEKWSITGGPAAPPTMRTIFFETKEEAEEVLRIRIKKLNIIEKAKRSYTYDGEGNEINKSK